MRIFKFNNKLVEEVSHVEGHKVIFFQYLKEEDKDKCPHCQKPIDIQHDIVEGCLNFVSSVKPVDTVDLQAKSARKLDI